MAAEGSKRGFGSGRGRQKGTPNKTTAGMREAYNAFLNENIPKYQAWMNRVAKHNPQEALNIAARFSEFCLPKLIRSEVTGADGAALVPPNIAITFGPGGGPGAGGVTQDENDAAAEAEDSERTDAAAGDGTAEP